ELDQELLRKPGIERDIDVHVIIKGKADDDIPKTYEEEYDIPIKLLTTISPRFAKIGTDYFEGVFQARNETPKRKASFIKAVEERANNGMAINNERPVKLGKDKRRFVKEGQENVYTATDYQATKKQIMRVIVHDQFEKFGGIMKENARLITRDKQRSKDVYRLTIMLEYPPFDWNDVLVDENETKLLVVKDLGKKIRYLDLMRNKNVVEPYSPGKYHIVDPQQAQVSQMQPQPSIIDPKTFQQTRLYFVGKQEISVGDEVLVVKLKDRWWLIP
ncbi:hypothetical protein GOV10_00325, partial [Candidatus Woesearchaeota archaeon]|nr:hypothetical protein [Candidatus Woesearchaeota archaeon]